MRWEMWLLYVLLRLCGWLPLRLLHAVGTLLGDSMRRWHTSVAHVVEVNLMIARPEINATARAALQRAALIEAGKSVFEILKVWGMGARRSQALVREVRGSAYVDAALEAGKGLIIAAPHLGCWELLNNWLCSRTPMSILYRPPRLATMEALLRKVRAAPEQVRAEGVGVRKLYRRLAAGGTVGILPDQKPREGEGQHAPFFGHDALTMVLLPRLAARTGATVLFAFAERLPRGKGYRIHILPAPEGLANTDMAKACAALNRGVEACVARAFTQYQWHYRRYSARTMANPYQ